MKISVCIPMYNELANVAETARQLYSVMESIKYSYGYDYEVIFADDGSTDGCAETLKNVVFIEGMSNFDAICLPENKGKGSALRAAVAASTGEMIITTDCDFAYGGDAVKSAVESFSRDTEIIIGSRNLLNDGYYGYTLMRKIQSKLYMFILNVFCGFPYSDSQCGFKVYRGDVGRRLFKMSRTDGFAYDYEIIMLASAMGIKVEEMPVKVVNYTPTRASMLGAAFGMLGDVFGIKRRVKRFAKRLKKRK